MILKIVAIAVIALIGSSEGEDVWDGLTGKFGQNTTDAFFQIPQTLKAALSQGWTVINGVNPPKHLVALGYRGDPRTIIYYSKFGRAAGYQFSVPVSDIDNTGVPINYTDYDSVITKTLNGVDYYTGTIYFGENKWKNTRYLAVQEKTGIVNFPTTSEDLLSKTSFLLKNCIHGMGIHYYRIDANLTLDNLYPWFFVSRDGVNINGVGFQAVGPISHGGDREWFEDPPLELLVATISDAPTWVGQFAVQYGIISFHLWFDDDPQTISCD